MRSSSREQRDGPLRRGNFNKAAGWLQAVDELGMPGLHFHDLRHTGNTHAARAGASLADLMARMGHDNVRAAITYQHASSEEDRAIAESLSARVEATRHQGGTNNDDEQESNNDDDDGDDGPAGIEPALSAWETACDLETLPRASPDLHGESAAGR